ncbi:Pyruvate dehydrogenase E1 component subunit alpha mitochondrial-like [Forsythia ovata]|uniref:Pyruvate dehydrogenase E1 component subunit alpha mitochondrial-like n=1 Tax=Forsythia ovata TaxID=205694 RepID=A0ABD1UW38_9LAMI
MEIRGSGKEVLPTVLWSELEAWKFSDCGVDRRPDVGLCYYMLYNPFVKWRQIAVGFLDLLSVGTVFAAETIMIKILEMDTYTYHGHSMSDPGSTYHTRDEISSEHDPVGRIRKLVLSHDLATEKELKSHA